MAQVTKIELLRRLADEYQQLNKLLDSLTLEQVEQPGAIGTWSIKDALAHLIVHEQRALQELKSALQGRRLEIDHSLDDVYNEEAVRAYRAASFDDVRRAWQQSYNQVVAAVKALREEDFEPASAVVQALDDSIDGALGNNTYQHYAEHHRQLEAWLSKAATAHA